MKWYVNISILVGQNLNAARADVSYARILNVTAAVWWQGFLLPGGPGALKCHCYFLTTSPHCEAPKCQPLRLRLLWKHQVLRGELQVEQRRTQRIKSASFFLPFFSSVIWWHPTKLLPLIFIFKCFVFVKPTTRTDESAFKNTSETSVNLSPREAAGLAGGFVQAAHICLFATGGGSLHILYFWKSMNGTL